MVATGLVQIIEGALLAAGKPLSVAQIGALFEERERPENTAIREALKEIDERCQERGFELVEVASGFRFQVRQALSPWVGRLWQERPQRYSRALLETLALIAYRQPITRGEIEEIRGVAVSSNIIRTLHEREWIRVVGHRDVPGRPAMYATTKQFLDYFSLKSLEQLPALAEIRDLDTLNAELGFSDPIPGSAASEGAPELTVVGGTDHTPSATGPDEGALDTDDTETATASDVVDGGLESAMESSVGSAMEDGEAEQEVESVAEHDSPASAEQESAAENESEGGLTLADIANNLAARAEQVPPEDRPETGLPRAEISVAVDAPQGGDRTAELADELGADFDADVDADLNTSAEAFDAEDFPGADSSKPAPGS